MKKFIRMGAFLLCGATFFTSCVSEDISPEVEQLRQAQVTYLNAKAAMEQSKAENEAAQAAKIQAETALIQVQVDYQQAVMQAQTDAEIADMKAAVAQAEADVAAAQQRAAEAEMAMQQALNDLAAQVNETAQEYLALYQSTTVQANVKLDQIGNLQGDIARFKANLDENGYPINLDRLAEQFSADISQYEAEIATLEATIARMEAIDLNTADVEAELETVQAELDQKEADYYAVQLEEDKAWNEYMKLYDAYNGGFPFGPMGALDLLNEIAIYEGNVANYEEQVSIYEAEVASLEAQLAPFDAELDLTGEGVPAAINDAEALLEVWIQAEAELMAADINHDAGDTEYDEAQTAVADAKTAFIDYAGDYDASYGGGYSDPRTIADMFRSGYYNPIAGTTFGDILIPYMSVSDDTYYNGLKNDYASALSTLNTYENYLENNNNNLSYYQSQLDAILTAKNVASVEELKTAKDEAFVVAIDASAQYSVIYSEMNALNNLKYTLEDYLDGKPTSIANQIESMQGDIEMFNESISDNEAALADNAIDQDEWDAKIVRAEQKLERLTEEYNALVALAADYLAQFNEVVEN